MRAVLVAFTYEMLAVAIVFIFFSPHIDNHISALNGAIMILLLLVVLYTNKIGGQIL